jgi:hypothetical protein
VLDFERRHPGGFILAICVLCSVASWQPLCRARGGEVPLQIELDAFSGRPNPRWELTGTEAAEFLTFLRALRPAQGSQPIADGLGYRGFIVSANDGPVDGYDDIRLCRGIVLARRGDRTETFSDPDRVLERWLLGSARGHVDDSVLQYIQSEITR